MSILAKTALILGGAMALMAACLLVVPERVLPLLRKFPRSRWMGWGLTAVDLLWVAHILETTPLPWFDPFRPYLILMVPVAFFVIVLLMDDLLASRALGGLFLLVPLSLLDAAFMHPSGFRVVVVVIAYIMAIKGMALVLSPYYFRKAMAFWLRGPVACRIWGGAGLFLGSFVMALGLWAF